VPFDPAGTLLVGKETQPGLGKTPVSLHLGADGSAAAALVDPQALAVAWAGTWTVQAGVLELDLDTVIGMPAPVTISLDLKTRTAVGTITRAGSPPVVTKVKVKVRLPVAKAKGWTAVVPRLRQTGGTAAGDLQSTVVVRNLAPAGGKPRPLRFTAVTAGASGLPGTPVEFQVLPGASLRLDAGTMPPLPPGIAETARHLHLRGKKGFDPSLVEVQAFEDALRGPFEPATSGTPLPVHWAKALSKKERAARDAPPLAAPWFRDDGGQGTLPREAALALRDLAPFTGDPPTLSVRVSVRTLDGVEVASSEVPLPRGGAATIRPVDLLGSPGDLPGGEGQVHVTGSSGANLPRGLVAGVLSSTVRQAGVPVAALASGLRHPEPPGRSAPLSVPYLLVPADGSASARVSVLSVVQAPIVLQVLVRGLDGTQLHSATVPLDPGKTVRVDPEAVGANLAQLPGGECQVVVGLGAGISTSAFLADGENRISGAPDTFFPGPVGFESAYAPGDPFRVDLLDVQDTLGSDPGDRDAWLLVRNGGTGPAALEVLVHGPDGLPVNASPPLALAVAPGESFRLAVEDALALLGSPLDPGPVPFVGILEVRGTAGGPLSVQGLQYRRSANARGGRVAVPTLR
jgi:hypothetical protein